MFSIVIPNFNRDAPLLRTIESARMMINFETVDEIIVVDDGSTSLGVANLNLEKQEKVRLIRHERNTGVVSARISGFLAAKSDFVIFMDSDDVFEKDALVNIQHCICSHQNYDAYFFPPIELIYKDFTYTVASLPQYAKFIDEPHRCSDYMMVLKRTNRMANLLSDLSYRCWELWFFVRLYQMQMSAMYCNLPIFSYIQHDGPQLSKRRPTKFWLGKYERRSTSFSVDMFLLLRKYHSTPSNLAAWRRRLIKETFLSLNIKSFLRLLF